MTKLVGYAQGLNEKNTEIMVLKEMVRSTKALLRAKDVDIQRLKRKVNIDSAVRLSHEYPILRRRDRNLRRVDFNRRQASGRSHKKMITFKEYTSKSRPTSYFRKKNKGQILMERDWIQRHTIEDRPKSFFQPVGQVIKTLKTN